MQALEGGSTLAFVARDSEVLVLGLDVVWERAVGHVTVASGLLAAGGRPE